MTVPVLELENVRKSLAGGFLPFKKPVLKDISFGVREGEIVGFLGPNGAGKTTTIKCVLGLISPDSGCIRLFGMPHRRQEARRRTGFLPENPYFYDYLTGLEFLCFYASLCGLDGAAARKRSGELLERVGLEHAGHRPLRKYSRGMLQRVGLAQALVSDPDLVILDEPMSGLDPFGRREVRDLILELRRAGKTVFFSSHILADVELLCDRVVILKDGMAQTVDVSSLLKNTAGAESYDIVVRGLPAKTLGMGAVLERDGALLFRAAGAVEKDRLLRRALEAGGSVESVSAQKPDLEKIFLDVYQSGEKPREGQP